MLLYRIVHQKYAGDLYASGRSGRFNSEGKKVIYTTGSISLAMLENMVHRNGAGFNTDFKIMVIYVPDDLDVEFLNRGNIPAGWNTDHDYLLTQPLGDKWFDAAKTPVLRVPSAVVPQEYNYIINTSHPAFKHIKLIDALPFFADKRIDEIITKYTPKKG